MRAVDADWRLGVAATGLGRANRGVVLVNCDKVPYDWLLIATCTRARPWFNPEEAKLEGLFTLRTSDDAAALQAALHANPGRVLIVGSGFIGSEMASVCCELGPPVPSLSAATPRWGARRGDRRIAAQMQRAPRVPSAHRCPVEALKATPRLACATRFSDGTTLDVDGGGVALGSIRNIEWLVAQLATGFGACVRCRLPGVRHQRVVTDTICRRRRWACPHVRMSTNSVAGALGQCRFGAGRGEQHGQPETDRCPHLPLPSVGLSSV
jgi:3-phenylpropionate/trans-cinnamate dioxygenase ferredoxin reductase subunit